MFIKKTKIFFNLLFFTSLICFFHNENISWAVRGSVDTLPKIIAIVPATGYTNPSKDILQSAVISAQKMATLLNNACADLNIVTLIVPNTASGAQNYASFIDGLVIAGGTKKASFEIDIAMGIEDGEVDLSEVNDYLIQRNKDLEEKDRESSVDLMEIALLKELKNIAPKVPVLGIDAGMHNMSVLSDGRIDFLKNGVSKHVGIDTHTRHSVKFVSGSKLEKIAMQSQIDDVYSYHCKHVTFAGNSLKPVAFGHGNVIEAIDSNSLPFFLGLQWHIEEDINANYSRNIARAFCQAVMIKL